jgi:hypothetical protein
MPHVRCSLCRARQTLTMHPEEYVRVPRCPYCRKKMFAHWQHDRRLPHWYVDRYRSKFEAGGPNRPKPCNCYGYSFPHHRGRGFCEHNPKLDTAALQARAESGCYA